MKYLNFNSAMLFAIALVFASCASNHNRSVAYGGGWKEEYKNAQRAFSKTKAGNSQEPVLVQVNEIVVTQNAEDLKEDRSTKTYAALTADKTAPGPSVIRNQKGPEQQIQKIAG